MAFSTATFPCTNYQLRDYTGYVEVKCISHASILNTVLYPELYTDGPKNTILLADNNLKGNLSQRIGDLGTSLFSLRLGKLSVELSNLLFCVKLYLLIVMLNVIHPLNENN